jgi:hypothetical protein
VWARPPTDDNADVVVQRFTSVSRMPDLHRRGLRGRVRRSGVTALPSHGLRLLAKWPV